MKNFNFVLLGLTLLISTNSHTFDYAKAKLNEHSVAAGAALTATVLYVLKKVYNVRILNSTKAEQEKYQKENIQITPNTVFAFDINDVIIEPDFSKIWSIIYKEILKSHKMEVGSALFKYNLWKIVIQCAAKGCVPEEYLNRIQEKYPQYKELCAIGIKLANAQKEISGMFELIQKLHADGHKLVFFSNISKDKLNPDVDSSIEALQKEFPVLQYFDLEASFLTTHANMQQQRFIKKPNPDAYKLFLEKFSQKYPGRKKDIVFVEDRIKNVRPAQKEGIATIWFTSSENLKAVLGKKNKTV